MNRRLDYVPRLDPRNLAYKVRLDVPDINRWRYWAPGVVLDQGQEGSCVGHGIVAEYLASPVRGKVPCPPDEHSPAACGHRLAEAVYDHAKEIDEWEGVDYDGTSVRAGMLVARERGWCTGFQWATNMVELRKAIEFGPVVIGVEVTDSMFDAPGGVVTVSGAVAGGHCLLITGYRARHPRLRGPAWRLRNSWGPSWGVNGSAYIAGNDLQKILFGSGGEAAIPIGRAA